MAAYGLLSIAMLLSEVFAACPQAAAAHQGSVLQGRPFDTVVPAKGKIYDCAANVLYCMAKLFGFHISYEEALKLLPPQPDGNNMLEVKAALSAVDCGTQAFWLDVNELADLTLPAVVLGLSSRPVVRASKNRVGHFFIVLPLDSWHVGLIDWPGRAAVVPRQSWRAYLEARGISRLAALVLES